jgi:hypothetical protein
MVSFSICDFCFVHILALYFDNTVSIKESLISYWFHLSKLTFSFHGMYDVLRRPKYERVLKVQKGESNLSVFLFSLEASLEESNVESDDKNFLLQTKTFELSKFVRPSAFGANRPYRQCH